MGQRELDPRLKALFDAKKKVYSISKLNTIDQCEYQAYLSYVKHMKQSSSCYSILGTRIHDCLEAIMNDESTEEVLLWTIVNKVDKKSSKIHRKFTSA